MSPASPESIADVLHALQFAAHKHRDQRRKGPEASPYINHPIALANVLWREAGVHEPAIICAALLHDTVEDTETTGQELIENFGAKVAGIVLEVTDDKSLEKPERKRLQVEHAPHISREAKLVKFADKICNLRDVATAPPAFWPLERRQAYFDWAKQVIDGMRGVHPRLEKLFDEAFRNRP